MTPPIRTDCLHFRGDKPCRLKRACDGCPGYEPLDAMSRVLVIKCRAQGDVLRTTPLLHGIKRKWPKSEVTWVVDPESVDLVDRNPLVDRVLPLDAEIVPALGPQRFDALVSLDKEPGPAGLAQMVTAKAKFGFGLSRLGRLSVFNRAAEYALRLGIDDDLKFRVNRKTYQEIAAEAAELEYRRDEYVFALADRDRARAAEVFADPRVDPSRPSVGLNTGAGAKFETKQWPTERWRALIGLLRDSLGANVFLLGGRREEALNRGLAESSGGRAIDTGSGNSLLEFAGIIDRLDAVVTSDTLGMHLAIALKKRLVVLFGPTCPQEIDLYDRGMKLFTGEACAPCYRQTCEDGRCMAAIAPEAVLAEVRGLLPAGAR